MTHTEPTLSAPLQPSTVDFGAILTGHAELADRIEALRPGNKDRLFDGLMAAGITHVTVIFDGAGDSGQIESIGAWSGDKAVVFPATEISYAAITWDAPEVEMRSLSLEVVVEQLVYDFLSDTHGGWENNDGAYGEFLLRRGRALHPSGVQRAVHLVRTLHPRLLRGLTMAHPYHHALSSVKKWYGRRYLGRARLV